MAARILNIEIGKRICKVCVSNKKGKAYEISESFVFPTPDGSVADGQIIDAIALGEELKNELGNHSVYLKNAVFSIPSTKIATREVTMPLVKDDQVKNIVATNASDYFPVDVTKYMIDSVILDKTEAECRVLVMAIPSVIIDSYINLAEQAGLVISSLDFCANSQYQVLRTIGGEDVTMYVTVDTDCTSVLFMEGATLLMQRMLITGADRIVTDYMAENDLNEFQYLEAIQRLNGEKEDVEVDISSYEGQMDMLASSISRSRDFFLGSKFAEKTVTKVVIMGTCGHIKGLKEKIGESLGIESEWLEELEGVAGLANSINDISLYIDCLGSNLSSLSFLPKEYLEKNGNKGKYDEIIKQNYGKFVFLLGVGLAIILAGSQFVFNILKTNELEQINARISEIQYAEERYNAYVSYTEGSSAVKTFVDSSVKNNASIIAFFEEMELKMPSCIKLLSASCTETGVSMSITVDDYDDAVACVRGFRSFESLDVVSINTFSKSGDDIASTVSLSISCTYKPEPVEEIPVEELPAEQNAEAQTEG